MSRSIRWKSSFSTCFSDRIYGTKIGRDGVPAVRGVDVAMGTGTSDGKTMPLPVACCCCCGSAVEVKDTVH